MLLSRTQGARPVTLIAYALLRGAAIVQCEGRDSRLGDFERAAPSVGRNSVGTVVAFSCLLELHRRHTVRRQNSADVTRQLVPCVHSAGSPVLSRGCPAVGALFQPPLTWSRSQRVPSVACCLLPS